MTPIEKRFADLADAVKTITPNINCMGYVPPRGIDVFYTVAATQTEKDSVNALVASWDWTPRRPKDYVPLISEIDSLPSSDTKKLTSAIMADFLRSHPAFATKFSISLVGDELDV